MSMRRMFSKRIISSGKFLKMPHETQSLYFHLCMNADDDGVVEAFSVMRSTGLNDDNFKILVAKQFIIPLDDDDVSFILDWHEHNLIRADRKTDSIYKELLVSVLPNIKLIEPKQRADLIDKTCKFSKKRISDVQMTSNGQRRLGKSKVNIGKNNDHLFEEFWKEYPRKVSKKTAQKAWDKIKVDDGLFKCIMIALNKYKKSDQWTKDNGQFIPHPSTWLNQERWNDEVLPPSDKKEKTNEVILHDGQIAIKRFGKWTPKGNPDAIVDPHYYPEINKY